VSMIVDGHYRRATLRALSLAKPSRPGGPRRRLTFEHQFILCKRRILRAQPFQALGSADFLDVNILKLSFEMTHPLFDVCARVGSHSIRSSGIDVAK
jgi:hypothetical protein